jgi:hypothetical protein
MKIQCYGALCALVLCTSTAHAGLFEADSFYSCVLDQMPGVANDTAALTIVTDCGKRFDPVPQHVERRTGWSASYATAEACITDKTRSTASYWGAGWIDDACRHLYGPPPPPPSPTSWVCPNGFVSPFPC